MVFHQPNKVLKKDKKTREITRDIWRLARGSLRRRESHMRGLGWLPTSTVIRLQYAFRGVSRTSDVARPV